MWWNMSCMSSDSRSTKEAFIYSTELYRSMGFLGGASGKDPRLPMQETQVLSLGWEEPLQ